MNRRNVKIVPSLGAYRVAEDDVVIATFKNLDDAILFIEAVRKGVK